MRRSTAPLPSSSPRLFSLSLRTADEHKEGSGFSSPRVLAEPRGGVAVAAGSLVDAVAQAGARACGADDDGTTEFRGGELDGDGAPANEWLRDDVSEVRKCTGLV